MEGSEAENFGPVFYAHGVRKEDSLICRAHPGAASRGDFSPLLDSLINKKYFIYKQKKIML